MSEKEVIDLLDEREKEGVKFDSGKLRMDLLPPDALEALARILTDGERVVHIPGYDSSIFGAETPSFRWGRKRRLLFFLLFSS